MFQKVDSLNCHPLYSRSLPLCNGNFFDQTLFCIVGHEACLYSSYSRRGHHFELKIDCIGMVGPKLSCICTSLRSLCTLGVF